MSDPQDRYRSFLRDHVAPGLRSLGLRGSGTSYVLPDDGVWAIVGFQSDGRLTAQGIAAFTINLTKADKAAWARVRDDRPWYPAKPPASGASGMEPAECIRIGNLIPVDASLYDRWWLLDDGTTHPFLEHPLSGPLRLNSYGSPQPAHEVAKEVVAAIRDHAIPWFKGEHRVALPGAEWP